MDATATDELYSEILHFLETTGSFPKTAKKFRKESKCSGEVTAILPLAVVIANARRRYGKKLPKRSAAFETKRTIDDVTAARLKEEKEQQAEHQLKEDVKDFVAQLGDPDKRILLSVVQDTESHSKKKRKRSGRSENEQQHQEGQQQLEASVVSGDSTGESGPTVSKKKKIKDAVEEEKFAAREEKITVQAASDQNKKTLTENQTPQFRRVDSEKWSKAIKDERLKNQSYALKNGDRFAAKAAADLGRVRGKDFRKEMQKKKRSSWQGAGEMDLGVNSIPFSSDSD